MTAFLQTHEIRIALTAAIGAILLLLALKSRQWQRTYGALVATVMIAGCGWGFIGLLIRVASYDRWAMLGYKSIIGSIVCGGYLTRVTRELMSEGVHSVSWNAALRQTLATSVPDLLYINAIRGKDGLPLIDALLPSRSSVITIMFLAWLWLNETLTVWEMCGAGCVIFAIALVALSPQRKKQEQDNVVLSENTLLHRSV
jgi:drug/metabolite transporter (DMT)-like permease